MPPLRMTEGLSLPGELRTCTAGGRRSKFAISAAVGECKEMRKPAAFSGHRKVDETGRASVPQPSENARKSVSPQRFPRKARRETLVSLPGTLSWLRGASETSAVEESFRQILYSSLRAGRSLHNRSSRSPSRSPAKRVCRDKGEIAPCRCRGQEEAGRNFRSGRKTRGSKSPRRFSGTARREILVFPPDGGILRLGLRPRSG